MTTKSDATQAGLEISDVFFPQIWSEGSSVKPHTPVPGISIWPVHGKSAMMTFVRIDPDTEMPMHNHPHEQAGTVLEGSLTLTVGGVTRTLSYGDAYFVEPNVSHGAKAGSEGCLVIDAFSPPRDEYLRAR